MIVLKEKCLKFVTPCLGDDVIRINDILIAADINLDDFLPGHTKPIRRTGAVIFLTIVGSNSQCMWPPCEKIYEYELMKGDDEAVVYQPIPMPSLKAAGYGYSRLMMERRGIKIVIVFAGDFVDFKFSILLLTLVSGMGLMGISTYLTDFLLVYIMPERERYNEYKWQYSDDFHNNQKSDTSSSSSSSSDIRRSRKPFRDDAPFARSNACSDTSTFLLGEEPLEMRVEKLNIDNRSKFDQLWDSPRGIRMDDDISITPSMGSRRGRHLMQTQTSL